LLPIKATHPSITSERLCGIMFVAIPTAIPLEPLINNCGTLVGSIVGSFSESSKFSWKSTVSLSISSSMCWVKRSSLASVYRMAAGPSPSWLPCGTQKQDRSEEHTSELQSRRDLVCRLLLEKKKRHTDTRRN